MISVCLATYNGEKYIRQQLESILSQLSDSDEVIISDDGSTDLTLKIIEDFKDKRIKTFKNNKNHGINGNFENALNCAAGDFIFLSDQDDVWLPNKVKNCISYLKENDCIVHDGYITDENLVIQSNGILNGIKLNGFFRNLCRNNYTGCCMAFKRNVLKTILPFPKSKYFYHDQWIGLLCELKFKVLFIREKLIYFRRHGENTSTVTKKSKRSLFTKIISRFQLFYSLIKRIC